MPRTHQRAWPLRFAARRGTPPGVWERGWRIESGRGRRGRLRRAPAATIAAVAILLAAPLLGAAGPSQQILGETSSGDGSMGPGPRSTGPIDGATGQGSRGDAPGRVPDPAGDRSAPIRLPPAVASLSGYRWPVRNATLTLPFGPSPFGEFVVRDQLFHDGIDLATWCGDPIRAAHDGTVLAAGRHFDAWLGWDGDLTAYTARLTEKHLWTTLPIVVVIDDGNGYRSIYAHLRSISVKAGDVVSAGDRIGTEGDTGRATGCHLHYGLFSPFATSTMVLTPTAAAHMLLPAAELARIDPLLVLPPLASAGIH